MSGILQISAKKLGSLAMAQFCTRCFWLRFHMESEPPFSVFPQIFNQIDPYTKRFVHCYFEEKRSPPPWLKDLGPLNGFVNPPSSRTFRMPIGENVLLTGEADGIYTRPDGKLVIVDFKTAMYQGIDDPLYAMYRVQLNAYRMLAKHTNVGDADTLALVYCQPCCSENSARLELNRRDDGYALGFRCQILRVPVDGAEVLRLAQTAWEIYSKPSAPQGRDGCKDCAALKHMVDVHLTRPSSRGVYAANFGAN